MLLKPPALEDFPFDELAGDCTSEDLMIRVRNYLSDFNNLNYEYVESIINTYTSLGLLEPSLPIKLGNSQRFKPEYEIKTRVDILSFLDYGTMHQMTKQPFSRLRCIGNGCPKCLMKSTVDWGVLTKEQKWATHREYSPREFTILKIYVHPNEGIISEGEYEWFLGIRQLLGFIADGAEGFILKVKEKGGYMCYDDCTAIGIP